ncbi:ATP-binding cassette sub-family A member 7 [Hyalella azteca]|uniref:ATP-binding cassette sub-family A member 7 n=1 Tax=Hyalella azteca TaxID=294128 RepID=A0A979FLP1_HYAAZ|nr:ATP-binding cassette sub-family A member 7 [Hyalella azteca]
MRAAVVGGQRSVVVSSHSLDDIDVLCDRVLVLRNGRPVATGTTCDVASRHGRLLTLTLRCCSADADVRAAVLQLLHDAVPCLHLQGGCGSTLVLGGGGPVVLSVVVRALEEARERRLVVDYSFTNASFEEVFRQLTAQQNDGFVSSANTAASPFPLKDRNSVSRRQLGLKNGSRKADVTIGKLSSPGDTAKRQSFYDNVNAILTSSPVRLLKQRSSQLTPDNSVAPLDHAEDPPPSSPPPSDIHSSTTQAPSPQEPQPPGDMELHSTKF